MRNINDLIRKEFVSSVKIYFSDIVCEYNSEIIEINKDVFKFKINDFDYYVCLTFSHMPAINIIVVPNKGDDFTIEKDGIGIVNFVKYKNTKYYRNIDLRFKKSSDVASKLKFLSNLLIEYCDQLFEDGYSFWNEVNEFIREGQKDRNKGVNSQFISE